MATVSLWDSSITVDTPGVIYATETGTYTWQNPNDPHEIQGSQFIGVLNPNNVQVDSDYIVSGEDAYVTRFIITNRFRLNLDQNFNPSDEGSSQGPDFTEDARDNMGVAVRLVFSNGNTAVYKWTFAHMFGPVGGAFSDESEPYASRGIFSYPTSTFPTPNYYATAQTAQLVFVDRSHPNIDWDNLEFTSVITVGIDDVAETLLDGASDITLTGTFEHEDSLAVTLAAEATDGTLGTLTQDNSAGTWSVTLTMPAAVVNQQTIMFRIEGTDSGDGYGDAFLDLFVRGLTFLPVHHPARDFNIENDISGEESLYGIWVDLDADIMWLCDSDGLGLGSGSGNGADARLRAFVFSARTPHPDSDLVIPSGHRFISGLDGDDDYWYVGQYDDGRGEIFNRSNDSYFTILGRITTSDRLMGMTGTDLHVFAVDRGTHIRAWNRSTRNNNTSVSFSTSDLSDVGDLAGIHTDGETLWGVDIDNRTVVAFDLSAKTRTPERDFSLVEANGDPWGIWGDDTHFYITDTTARKVFAYAYNVHRVSIPDIADIEVETGQDFSMILPEAELLGQDNSVSEYELSNVPAGLTFDAGQRILSGTIGSTAEVRTLTYTATDIAGNSAETDIRMVIWKARPTLYPWEFQQTPTAAQFNDHISDFIDYYAGRDGEFRPLASYRLPDPTRFAVLYLNSDGDMTQLAPGERGQVLYGQGTGSPPAWDDYAGDDFEVEDWLISRFDSGDSDWSGTANATRQFTRDHSLGRIPRLFSWCFEYVGTSLDGETGYSQNDRVFMPFGALSSGQEEWEFVPRLLWASDTQVRYEVARWPAQTETNARLAGFVFRHRASGARVLARNIQRWGLRLFLWG